MEPDERAESEGHAGAGQANPVGTIDFEDQQRIYARYPELKNWRKLFSGVRTCED